MAAFVPVFFLARSATIACFAAAALLGGHLWQRGSACGACREDHRYEGTARPRFQWDAPLAKVGNDTAPFPPVAPLAKVGSAALWTKSWPKEAPLIFCATATPQDALSPSGLEQLTQMELSEYRLL